LEKRGLFFDSRRYDLAKVGRYKYNKKLDLSSRITNQIAFDNILNTETGEVIVEKGATITAELANEIQNSGINIVDVNVEDKKVRIIGNGTVDIKAFVDSKKIDIKEKVNYEVLKNILETSNGVLRFQED